MVDADVERSGDSCTGGDGGFSDFGPGMNVTVRDGDGNIIGSTSTVPGPLPTGELAENADIICIVEFTVDGLPEVPFYEIEVGRRGALSYSFADLEDVDWRVELSLGD